MILTMHLSLLQMNFVRPIWRIDNLKSNCMEDINPHYIVVLYELYDWEKVPELYGT